LNHIAIDSVTGETVAMVALNPQRGIAFVWWPMKGSYSCVRATSAAEAREYVASLSVNLRWETSEGWRD
jgi:hypothetical protein